MRFQRLDATFGRLERCSLAFSPGLNVIESPNESGKSTLAVFLRVMLYGLAARERGALAEKSRYLPWSGAPMQGTLELMTEDFGAVTLCRDTMRANSPMGRFSAVCTGTGDEAPGLHAADCGETLLGVPREVYERSAFIRQSGLAIDQDAGLERRIAALITTGEEGASYSEAAAALKKQLNARRANARNGRIPVLEREIEADEAALAELQALQAERDRAEETLAALRAHETALRADVAAHDLADRQARRDAWERARREVADAERDARAFRRMLEESHTPSRETLEICRDRLRTAVELKRQQRDAEARRQAAAAEQDAFRTARRPSVLHPLGGIWLAALAVCVALFAAALTPLALPVPTYASGVAAILFAALLASEYTHGRRRRQAYTERSGALAAALGEANALCAALAEQEQRTLEPVFASIPVGDAAGAEAYIREGLARYDRLAQSEDGAHRKQQYFESLPEPELADVLNAPVERPSRGRAELSDELERTAGLRAEAQSRADYTAGRLRAIGDAAELEASLARKQTLLAEARREYDAIVMAADALERANSVLQSRFSPELGRRAAAYFSMLTGGRYSTLALDRAFHALATETGDSVGRDASLLSRGANDQLYLAVRLAICDVVLPEEKHVPLVLDEALVSFDDRRCRTALELLLQLAGSRQILLLTCQHREAAYLAGRENVTILTL